MPKKYDYLGRSTQEIPDFFETIVKNLQTAAPPLAVRNIFWEKKKQTAKIWKASVYEDSDKDSSEDKKPASRKNLFQYHRKCSHSVHECKALKALINKTKSNKSEGYMKEGKKPYTNHEVSDPIKKI